VLVKYKNKGFSLLDLLIAIMILGILVVLVTPPLHSMISTARLNEATGEVVSGLQYARNLAVNHQRPFGLLADVNGNWFRVFDYQYMTDSSPHYSETPPVDAYGVILNPVDKTWYTIDFDNSPTYEGVRLSSVPGGGVISFYPDGHSLSTDSVFVLGFGEDQRTVTVDGTTGQVSVQ
jgi:prepilin-type N-terminal cleavage/methylation domain-containing protein